LYYLLNNCCFCLYSSIFGRPFVKRFARCYRSVVRLSVLSVKLVYCGQTVGRIKMKLGMQEGLPRPWPHCVKWEPSSPPPKEHSLAIFGPYLLRPNGCMDQHVTWYRARPQPRRLCVRWGPRSPSAERERSPKKLSAHVYCGQTPRWIKMVLGIEVGLSPGDFVLDGIQPHHQKRGRSAPSPIFGPFLL